MANFFSRWDLCSSVDSDLDAQVELRRESVTLCFNGTFHLHVL